MRRVRLTGTSLRPTVSRRHFLGGLFGGNKDAGNNKGDSNSGPAGAGGPFGGGGKGTWETIKEAQQFAKMMREMRDVADKAGAGPGGMEDVAKRLPTMETQKIIEGRQILTMQRQMAGSFPAMGGVSERHQSSIDRMIKTFDEELKKRDVDTTNLPPPKMMGPGGQPNMAGMMGNMMNMMAAQQQQQQQQSPNQPPEPKEPPPSVGKSSTSAPSKASSTAKAAPVFTSDGQNVNDVDLGPEIEAMFDELRRVREKKNVYRVDLQKKTVAYDKLLEETTKLRSHESNLKEKLSHAERNVMLLNSEALELGESKKSVKALEKENRELRNRIKALEVQDVAPVVAELEKTKQAVRTKDDHIRSLNRKLDRSRRRNPLMQFSMLLSDMEQLAPSSSTSSGADHKAVDEAFVDLQAQAESGVEAAWATSGVTTAAGRVLVRACEQFVATSLDYAAFDAVVTVTGDAAPLKAALEAQGMTVTADETNAGRFIVQSAQDAPKPPIGPFGALSCWKMAPPTGIASKVENVAPFVSSTLAQNIARASTTIDTSRSSKPGGQAANSGETQITVKLFIDGELCVVSEAQDTRSAMNNRDAALDRLYNEKLKLFNDQIKAHTPRLERRAAAEGGDVAALIPKDRWETLCAGAEEKLAQNSAVESCVVNAVKRLSVA